MAKKSKKSGASAKTAKATKKKGRMCGGCGKRNTGHNARTCPGG